VKPVLEVYQAARAKGLEAFFITGRREAFRADTEANLKEAGYEGWSELMMKPDAYSERSVVPLKTRCREQIEAKGYRIILNIGDQDSDLEGGHAEHTIRLPNVIYRSP
jgi:acid phosphatase